jgi:hypothetical protein
LQPLGFEILNPLVVEFPAGIPEGGDKAKYRGLANTEHATSGVDAHPLNECPDDIRPLGNV